MSLLVFAILTLVIVAFLWVLFSLAPPTWPPVVKVIITVVVAFIFLFMVLALFKVMPLPFDLT